MQSKISSKYLLFIISIAVVACSIIIFFLTVNLFEPGLSTKPILQTCGHSSQSMSYHTNIVKDTEENTNFRHVLFTGPKSQLVVMSIPPGGEIGEETHQYTEQTLFFLSGSGEGMLNDKKFPLGPGDVVVVTADTKHNFRNTGTEALKIYTVYAPPNHLDGRVHRTKADADADTADEAVGESDSLK